MNRVAPTGSVAVWELELGDENALAELRGEFEVIHPTYDCSPRHRAQAGLFTRVHSLKTKDLRSLLEQLDLDAWLTTYEIPANKAISSIADLHRMNISFQTLFPDVDGIARHVNFAGIVRGLEALGHLIESWEKPPLTLGTESTREQS